MSTISAQQVKELREKTGSGLMECKKALQEADGNLEEAVTILRKKGQAAAEKKAGRSTSEGAIGSYIHTGGRVGVLIEVNCETDFVANTDEFKALVRDIAMQVAAASPSSARWVRRDEVPKNALDKERDILKSQAEAAGKPANIVEKIVEGKLAKFYSENVLMEQPFIKNPDQTVDEYLKSKVAILKENIQVRRFVRYERGEAI
ncbi:MAG: translation elongation factor Ts [Acidobacteriota bacterium]|nr:MAG: translation elongation factor Ts [Acidobacteriota bacterium]